MLSTVSLYTGIREWPDFEDHIYRLVHRRFYFKSDHVNPRHHHLTHQRLTKLEDRSNHCFLFVFDHRLVLARVQQKPQAIFAQKDALRRGPRRSHLMADMAQDCGKGCEKDGEYAERWGKLDGELILAPYCPGSRQQLGENEDN